MNGAKFSFPFSVSSDRFALWVHRALTEQRLRVAKGCLLVELPLMTASHLSSRSPLPHLLREKVC